MVRGFLVPSSLQRPLQLCHYILYLLTPLVPLHLISTTSSGLSLVLLLLREKCPKTEGVQDCLRPGCGFCALVSFDIKETKLFLEGLVWKNFCSPSPIVLKKYFARWFWFLYKADRRGRGGEDFSLPIGCGLTRDDLGRTLSHHDVKHLCNAKS